MAKALPATQMCIRDRINAAPFNPQPQPAKPSPLTRGQQRPQPVCPGIGRSAQQARVNAPARVRRHQFCPLPAFGIDHRHPVACIHRDQQRPGPRHLSLIHI